MTTIANIDGTAGRVKLNMERVTDLRPGSFRIRIELSSSKSKKIVTTELVSVTATISMQSFSFELHKEEGASD